jgi:hypothetical protein
MKRPTTGGPHGLYIKDAMWGKPANLGAVYGMRVHVVPAAGPDPTP